MNRRTLLAGAAGFVTAGLVHPERVCARGRTSGPAKGPLRPHPENPRYFTDGSGRAIYLTGSHTWANLQDSSIAPLETFDWQGYIDMMVSHNHNFMRLWSW